MFQSPSHRGPRARLAAQIADIEQKLSFSPLLIGGRARGATVTTTKIAALAGFSPLLIGGRARGE